MMKKLLSLSALFLCSLVAWAQTYFFNDGINYKIISEDEKTVEVAKKTYTGDIVIPEKVVRLNGTEYSVTSIGESAFSDCRSLTSVTIGNSVTSIGDYAFSRCIGLTSITIPNSVTSIGYDAFGGCSHLASVHITDLAAWCKIDFSIVAGASNPLVYAHHLYLNGTEVTDLVIPEGITDVKRLVFKGCSGLTSVTIPNSVTSIGESAFSDCIGLNSLTIGKSVNKIAYGAFSGCTGLTSIYVDNENTKYDSRNNCNAIIETSSNTLIAGCKKTIIPNSVTTIGTYAFSGCSGLTSVTIPNSVTTIGSRAFFYCTGLTSVTIPNSVTNIVEFAFVGCTGLTSLSIGNSVTSIGMHAFYDCSNLSSVTIGNSLTEIGTDAFYGTEWYNSQNDGLLYLDNILLGYKGNQPEGTVIINQGTRSIVYGAFSGCSGLTSVNIPNSVTNIGEGAFSGCSELAITFNCKEIGEWRIFDEIKEMIIGNEVESYNLNGGFNCSKITFHCKKIGGRYYLWRESVLNEIVFGEEVEEIETFALSSLAPLSVTYLSDKIFTSFSFNNLQSIVIGPKVRSINRNKLIKFDDITSIIVDSENTRYDSRNNCNAIIATASNTLVAGFKNTTIPNSVTSIGQMAFYDCSGLTSVTIPESVTSIGERAFWDCRGLTSLIIPNSVTDIGINAFCGCSGLTSITVESENPNYDSRDNCNAIIETSTNTLISGCMNTVIPNTVTSISYNAFFGCNGLTSVTIPNSVSNIGADAFYGCRGLTEIYSMISEPFEIATTCWQNVNKDIPLYVPAGCKAKYEATPGWNEFTNIVEIKEAAELEPVDESDNTDYGNGDIDDTTELNGNVVGNIYYNIADENGAYSSSEGCIILKKSTRDSSVEGTDIFGEEFKNNFTGIIFKVHAGSGTIKVNAEAIGNMILKVKVGNNAPLSIELQGKMKASFPYTVSEESYVYIYGGESSSAAKGTRAADTESVLKIYGIEWSDTYEPSSIESLNNVSDTETVIYNLSGQRVKEPTHGVYVKKGRKVIGK